MLIHHKIAQFSSAEQANNQLLVKILNFSGKFIGKKITLDHSGRQYLFHLNLRAQLNESRAIQISTSNN